MMETEDTRGVGEIAEELGEKIMDFAASCKPNHAVLFLALTAVYGTYLGYLLEIRDGEKPVGELANTMMDAEAICRRILTAILGVEYDPPTKKTTVIN